MAEPFKVKARKNPIYITTMVLFVLMSVSILFAHGPKGHEGSDFTALQAIKKGITLYDRLVGSGKLEESWETGLKDIEVSLHQRGNNQEFVIKFSRSKGDPQAVYIFFKKNGEYSGSNFTGD